jgi:hypothetical protein
MFCPWLRVQVPEIDELLPLFKNRMYWRIVTRGLNPLLGKHYILYCLGFKFLVNVLLL